MLSLSGIIIATISIFTVWVLIHYKLKICIRFNSRALLAGVACSKSCLYLSIVLLIASIGYEATGYSLKGRCVVLAGVLSYLGIFVYLRSPLPAILYL